MGHDSESFHEVTLLRKYQRSLLLLIALIRELKLLKSSLRSVAEVELVVISLVVMEEKAGTAMEMTKETMERMQMIGRRLRLRLYIYYYNLMCCIICRSYLFLQV